MPTCWWPQFNLFCIHYSVAGQEPCVSLMLNVKTQQLRITNSWSLERLYFHIRLRGDIQPGASWNMPAWVWIPVLMWERTAAQDFSIICRFVEDDIWMNLTKTAYCQSFVTGWMFKLEFYRRGCSGFSRDDEPPFSTVELWWTNLSITLRSQGKGHRERQGELGWAAK